MKLVTKNQIKALHPNLLFEFLVVMLDIVFQCLNTGIKNVNRRLGAHNR